MVDSLATRVASPLQACRASVTSFGSRYWSLFADPEFIRAIAQAEIHKSFRRVLLDPARGLVLLMSPGRAHERTSELAGDAIKGMASLLGISLVSLRSVRWQRRLDPPNTGPEADCSFYVGDQAEAYLKAEAIGEAAADRFVLDNPPDLVVEVGVTNVDKEKTLVYQDRGVAEYWRVDRKEDDATPTVTFLSLRGQRPPESVDASTILPRITPNLIEGALQVAARERDGQEALAKLQELMLRHGAIPTPGADHDVPRDVARPTQATRNR